MKCKNCGKEFARNRKGHKYCSKNCNWNSTYKRNKKNKIVKSLRRYYSNRDEILKQQSQRWCERYKSDEEFRKKRSIRDKTIRLVDLKDKKCVDCGTNKDLHRHHPDLKDYKRFVILCRPCHNVRHFG